jgi:hypothetical protein
MTDNVTATNTIGTYIIPILGLVIAGITAFGVFLGPRLVAKRQEKKEKLKTHFEGLKQKVISQILQIIPGIVDEYGTLDASTLRGSRTMEDDPFPIILGFDVRDEYQSFQAHYPVTNKKWRELIAQTWTHNKDAEVALKELEEIIKNKSSLPPIKLDDTLAEEKIIFSAIPLLFKSIYHLVQGKKPRYDFSKMKDMDYNALQLIKIENIPIAMASEENVEKYKAALLEVQNMSSYRERVLGLHGNAFQLMKRFEALAYELQLIYDYGLISKKAGHKFEPIKECAICKRIFH